MSPIETFHQDSNTNDQFILALAKTLWNWSLLPTNPIITSYAEYVNFQSYIKSYCIAIYWYNLLFILWGIGIMKLKMDAELEYIKVKRQKIF